MLDAKVISYMHIELFSQNKKKYALLRKVQIPHIRSLY